MMTDSRQCHAVFIFKLGVRSPSLLKLLICGCQYVYMHVHTLRLLMTTLEKQSLNNSLNKLYCFPVSIYTAPIFNLFRGCGLSNEAHLD